jgi:electron transport complex protein RnfC
MNLPSFSHGGIHPAATKGLTAGKPIRRFPFAPYLVILLSQHIGQPSRPTVREGEEVQRGQLIAEAQGFVSVPMHAPVTGRVTKIGKSLDMNGQMAPSMVIEPYPGSEQEVLEQGGIDPLGLSAEKLLELVQMSGMVGLGGAAFPTHVKIKAGLDKGSKILIVNGCECEPYLTCDHRVMLEYPAEVILGTRILLQSLGFKRALIAVEDNKIDAAEALRAAIEGGWPIEVRLLKTKYPQGAEKMLTRVLLDRDIPAGGLPADIGVMVSNVATLMEIAHLISREQGIIERVVTLSGEGLERPGNYLIPLGTPLDFILEQVGLKAEHPRVIFGGPMMGKPVACLQTPTTKGVTGILVLEGPAPTEPLPKTRPCIQCGECLNACPLGLNPCMLGRLAQKGFYDEMKLEQHLLDCFECGCCAYVCPSRIPLVQLFQAAKVFLRKLG